MSGSREMTSKEYQCLTGAIALIAEFEGKTMEEVARGLEAERFRPVSVYTVKHKGKDYHVVLGVAKNEKAWGGFVLELKKSTDPADVKLAKDLVDFCSHQDAPDLSGSMAKMGSCGGLVSDGYGWMEAIRSGMFGKETGSLVCANGQEIAAVSLTNKDARKAKYANADSMNMARQMKSNIDLRHRLRMKYEAKQAAAAAAKK